MYFPISLLSSLWTKLKFYYIENGLLICYENQSESTILFFMEHLPTGEGEVVSGIMAHWRVAQFIHGWPLIMVMHNYACLHSCVLVWNINFENSVMPIELFKLEF